MPCAPYSQGPCATCGAHRLLRYAHRTMCARYKCQKARLAGGGADDAVVPTFCFKRHPGPGAPQASRPAGGAAAGRPRCARRWLRLEAGLATEVLAFFWHPHHIAHHPRVHRQVALLAAVCRCILVLEDQLACSTSKRPIVAVHRAAASLSTAQRARGRVPCVAGVTTLDSGTRVALLQIIRASHSPASNGACQHLSRGGVNTFEHLYTAVVLTVITFEHRLNVNAPALWSVVECFGSGHSGVFRFT